MALGRPLDAYDVALDTTGLADGAHAVALVVEDAAGNEATVWSRSILVNNPGGAVVDTACTDGLNGYARPDGTVTLPRIEARAMPGPACRW